MSSEPVDSNRQKLKTKEKSNMKQSIRNSENLKISKNRKKKEGSLETEPTVGQEPRSQESVEGNPTTQMLKTKTHSPVNPLVSKRPPPRGSREEVSTAREKVQLKSREEPSKPLSPMMGTPKNLSKEQMPSAKMSTEVFSAGLPPVEEASTASTLAPLAPGALDHCAEKARKFVDWALQTNAAGGGLSRLFAGSLEGYTPPAELQASDAFNSITNKAKNRYPQVVCFDRTRVRLPTNEKFPSNYIHANHVKFKNCDRTFIATQLPTAETCVDFWRMVVSQEVNTIIALFDPNGEADVPMKATPVTPLQPSTPKPSKFGLISRFLKGKTKKSEQQKEAADVNPSKLLATPGYWPLKKNDYKNDGPFFINNRKVEPPNKRFPDAPTIYTIEIVEESCADATFVKLFNYTGWSKKKISESTPGLVRLIQQMVKTDPLQKGRIIVQCDDGINRSSVFILSFLIMNRIYKSLDVDVIEVCREMRNQRASSLQYRFHFLHMIYTVLYYIKECGVYNEVQIRDLMSNLEKELMMLQSTEKQAIRAEKKPPKR